MQYIYAALLLHVSGKNVNEETLGKVIAATGEALDEARIKTLIASLSEVDIDAAIKAAPQMAVTAVQEVKESATEKEEKAEEPEEKDDEAIAGLGALFG